MVLSTNTYRSYKRKLFKSHHGIILMLPRIHFLCGDNLLNLTEYIFHQACVIYNKVFRVNDSSVMSQKIRKRKESEMYKFCVTYKVLTREFQ